MKRLRSIILFTIIFVLLPFTLTWLNGCSNSLKKGVNTSIKYEGMQEKPREKPNTEPLHPRFQGESARSAFLIRWPMVTSTVELNQQVRRYLPEIIDEEIKNPLKMRWVPIDTRVDSIKYTYITDHLEMGYLITTPIVYTNRDFNIYLFIQAPIAPGEPVKEEDQ